VVPRAGLDGRGTSHPTPAFHPRTVQLVASRELDLGSMYHILTVPNQISSPSDKPQYILEL